MKEQKPDRFLFDDETVLLGEFTRDVRLKMEFIDGELIAKLDESAVSINRENSEASAGLASEQLVHLTQHLDALNEKSLADDARKALRNLNASRGLGHST